MSSKIKKSNIPKLQSLFFKRFSTLDELIKIKGRKKSTTEILKLTF